MDEARSKPDLKRALEAHLDIQSELQEIKRIAAWVEQRFHDREAIPFQEEGEHIDLRGTLLNGLLIRYRRCFQGDQRGGIDKQRGYAAIAPWIEIHNDELLFRANKVVAHAVSAAASTQLHVDHAGALSWAIQRPGTNQFDFTNLVKLCEEWLTFVGGEVEALLAQLRPLLTQEDARPPVFAVAPFTTGLDIQSARAKRGT